MTSSFLPTASPSRDRLLAMGAGAVALVAVGVAGGVLLSSSMRELRPAFTTSAPPLAAPTAAPLLAAPIAPPLAAPTAGPTPDAGTVAATAPSPRASEEAVAPVEASERARDVRTLKRRVRRTEAGMRRAVDRVPIYDEEW